MQEFGLELQHGTGTHQGLSEPFLTFLAGSSLGQVGVAVTRTVTSCSCHRLPRWCRYLCQPVLSLVYSFCNTAC